MSLYRQAGRPSGWLAASVVAALLLGLGLGVAVSQVVSDEPAFEDAVAEVQSDAATTADALELVALHYESAPEGARDQLRRAQESFDEVEPELRLLAPEETADAAEAVTLVASLVERNASSGEVEQAAQTARAAVRRAARLR
jgi:hypothetical protein